MGAGFLIDLYSYRTGQISGAKFSTNTGMTGWGMVVTEMGGGVPSLIATGLYFGIDAFYPGGFNGAMNDQGSLIGGTQKIIGIGNMFYKH